MEPCRHACLLQDGVAAVDGDVGAGHEAGGVGGEEDTEAVEVVDGAEAGLGRQRAPDLLLGLEGGHAVQGRVHVARGDAVDADVVLGPLGGERLAELDHAGLGRVVARLLLRVVDDAAAHRRHEDDAAGLLRRHHGAADGLAHEERAREVDVDEASEHLRSVKVSTGVTLDYEGVEAWQRTAGS